MVEYSIVQKPDLSCQDVVTCRQLVDLVLCKYFYYSYYLLRNQEVELQGVI